MLEKIIKRLNKTLKEVNDIQLKEIRFLRKEIKDKQIEMFEDFIMTINEIQDVQAMKISEDEKNNIRDSLIDTKRVMYVAKLIELSNSRRRDR